VLSIGSFLCAGSILSAVSVFSVMAWRSRGGAMSARR
jgi:hypothetical protein